MNIPDAGQEEEHWHIPDVHADDEHVINQHPRLDGVRDDPDIVTQSGAVHESRVVD